MHAQRCVCGILGAPARFESLRMASHCSTQLQSPRATEKKLDKQPKLSRSQRKYTEYRCENRIPVCGSYSIDGSVRTFALVLVESFTPHSEGRQYPARYTWFGVRCALLGLARSFRNPIQSVFIKASVASVVVGSYRPLWVSAFCSKKAFRTRRIRSSC